MSKKQHRIEVPQFTKEFYNHNFPKDKVNVTKGDPISVDSSCDIIKPEIFGDVRALGGKGKPVDSKPKLKEQVVVPKFESVKLWAKIRFIGPDGVMIRFNESHIVALALEDPKVKGKIWRLGENDKERLEITSTGK